jgi:hypothetical protein
MSEYTQLVTSEQADESLQLSRLRREIEQLKEQLKEQVAPPESPEPSAEAAVANLGLTAVAMQSDESAQVQEHDVALTPSPATTAESVRRGSDTGEEGRRRRPTSSLRHMRAVVRTVSVVKTKGLVQARLEAHEKALETLFESYNKYWENVGLSEALCATMAVVIVSATEDDVGPDGPTERQRVLAAVYGLSFGLAFIISTAGVSICVMLMVQFGFAVQKGAFILRYSVRSCIRTCQHTYVPAQRFEPRGWCRVESVSQPAVATLALA